MTPKVHRVNIGVVLEALPEGIALTLLAAMPAFLNLASERVFEEEKVLLLRAAAVLVLPGLFLAWREQYSRLFRDPIVLTFVAFTVMLLVAALAGVAPRDAFMGAYLRRHGMLTWLALAVLFAAMCVSAGSRAGRERLLTAVVVGSVWPSVYALLQHGGVDTVNWIGADSTRSVSTLGSPVMFGGYLAVVIPVTAMYVWRSKGVAALLILQCAALATSSSRGPFVAVVAAAFVFLVVAGWGQIPRRAVIGAVIALGIIAAALVTVRSRGDDLFDANKGSARVRVLIWKGVTTLMRSSGGRLWVGYGPESLRRVIPPYYAPELGRLEGNAMPDRAHNETLDTLVSAGLAGVLFQFAFFAATLMGVLRIPDRRMRAGLSAAAVGHLIEIQFGIASVVSRLTFLSIAAIAVGCRVPEPLEVARATASKGSGRRVRTHASTERPITPAARSWLWLLVPAFAGALSLWLSVLTFGAGPSARSGTADDLVNYLSDISRVTPFLYTAMLAVALFAAWSIAIAVVPRAPTYTLLRGAGLIAGVLAAIPLSITSSRADFFSKAGAAFEAQRQWTEAAVAYRQANQMEPSEPYYLTGLGRALVQESLALEPQARDAHLHAAREAFERAYALNPSDPDHAQHLASVLRIEAQSLTEPAREESLVAADRLYGEVTQFTPAVPSLWIEWAYVDVQRHQPSKALEKLSRAIALDDARVDLWLLRGDAHMAQHDDPEALADYDRALSRDPHNIAALHGRAEALAELQRRDEALAALDEALAFAPGDPDSQKLRAQIERLPERITTGR